MKCSQERRVESRRKQIAARVDIIVKSIGRERIRKKANLTEFLCVCGKHQAQTDTVSEKQLTLITQHIQIEMLDDNENKIRNKTKRLKNIVHCSSMI